MECQTGGEKSNILFLFFESQKRIYIFNSVNKLQ
jgi:hypothetical protein